KKKDKNASITPEMFEMTMPFPMSLPEIPVGCFQDDVLVLSADDTVTINNMKVPLVSCPVQDTDTKSIMAGYMIDTKNCDFNVHAAAQKVADFLKSKNITTSYDQLVIFSQSMKLATNPPGPLFYREGYRADDMGGPPLSEGYNTVEGLGLQVEMK